MEKTIALLSNNLFFAMGVNNYISDHELKNITSTEVQNKDFWLKLAGVEAVLIKSGFIDPSEILNLAESLLKENFKLIYIASDRDKLIPKLFSLGCQGIVDQEKLADHLSVSVRAVTSGGTYYSNNILSNTYMVLLGPLVELFEDLETTVDKLTPKEKQIFDLYSGDSLADIMAQLGIAKSTIHTHMESIRGKFGVEANRELITKYQIRQLKPSK